MVLRVCVTLFSSWTILLAVSCASGNELEPSFRQKESIPDPKLPTVHQFPKDSENNADSTCEIPAPLKSLVSAPPLLPILFAESAASLLAEQQCGRDAQKFLNELSRGTYWAARMFDASSKILAGMLAGHKADYGNFDECYNGGTEDFGTRYCLIDVAYNRTGIDTNYISSYSELAANSCAWDILKVKPRMWALDRSSVRLALCAPSSCTAKDVELSLVAALANNLTESASTTEFPFSISVDPLNCQARTERRIPTLGDQLFWAFGIALCTLIGVATWRHSSRPSAEEKSNVLASDIVDCFSIQRNMASLRNTHARGNFDLLHSWGLFVSYGIIYVHRYMQYSHIPTINPEAFPVDNENWAYIGLSNMTLAHEALFTLAAMMMTVSWLVQLSSGKPINLWRELLCKYIRITPSYAFVLFCFTSILPFIGSGALWSRQVEVEADVCRSKWWHNLLYINNYIGEGRYCMLQSWALAVTLQAQIVLFFVVMIFWKLPRCVNILFLILLIVGSASWASYVTYVNRVAPTVLPLFLFGESPDKPMEDARDDEYLTQYYVKTHLRIGSFIAGALIGVVLAQMKKLGLSFPRFWCVVVYVLGHVVLFTLHALVARTVWGEASQLENALYAGFHRPVYGIVAGAMMLAVIFCDNLEYIRSVLAPTWVLALNKLAFGIRLSHTLHLQYSHGDVRAPKVLSLSNMVVDFLYDAVAATIISLFLWLALESPIQQLRHLRKQRAAQHSKTD